MAGDFFGIDEFNARIINASEQVNTKSLIRNYVFINDTDSPFTAVYTHSIIGCDTTSGPITINLPPANGTNIGAGFVLTIKDESGTAGSNNITIDPDGSELIDGSATAVMTINYSSLKIYSNGSNWFIH